MITHEFIDRYVCNIDPLVSAASSLFSSGIGTALTTAAAGASLGATLAGGGGGSGAAPAPSAPTAPPPTNDPVGTRSGAGQKSPSSPSFVGSAALPQQQGYGQKSLLGQ